MDDEVLADAAQGLQGLLDAVDRGELSASSPDEPEPSLRIGGAVAALKRTVEE